MTILAVEIFLNTDNYTLIHAILGIIWSAVVGGTYALIYLIALDLTGWNNLWLKAIVTINALWLLGAGFVIKLLQLAQEVRDEPLSISAFYLAHLFFATFLYLFIKYFAGKKEPT